MSEQTGAVRGRTEAGALFSGLLFKRRIQFLMIVLLEHHVVPMLIWDTYTTIVVEYRVYRRGGLHEA